MLRRINSEQGRDTVSVDASKTVLIEKDALWVVDWNESAEVFEERILRTITERLKRGDPSTPEVD